MDKKLIAKLVAGIFGTAPFLASVSEQVLAAGTDIATSPLANRRSSDIKPNIMLVLDDSGSMQLDYMPDSVENNDAFGPGRRNHLCNTIYYNPNPTNPSTPLSPYLVPRAETGVNLNTADPATFTSAYDNGYWAHDQIGQSSGTAYRADLSADQGWGAMNPMDTSSRLFSSGAPAYYWSLVPASSTGVTPTASICTLTSLGYGNYSTATGVCSSNSSAPYNGSYFLVTTASPTNLTCSTANPSTPYLIWRRVDVSATSSPTASYDERQRFANWYSYYRNRMQMTKSAIGRAFLPLIGKKKYRAGFITIAPQQLDNGTEQSSVYSYNSSQPYNSKFLEIRNFDSTDLATNQPNRWFNILYAQRPNGKTPLREGLSRVGRYYAGKNDGPNTGMIPSNTTDPVQYACQQNFSILTTDGYWDSPVTSIGGFKLTHTSAMDNQDGLITETDAYGQGLSIGARPIYDGTSTSTATTTDRNNAYQQIACTYYLQSTQQLLKSTAQNLQSTQQALQTTWQKLQNTSQVLKSTTQDRISTSQVLVSTLQKLQSTEQDLTTTFQNLQATSQVRQTTTQKLQGTNQNLQSTSQVLQNTAQLMQIQLQQLKSTNQFTQGTRQEKLATSQVNQTATQQLKSTNQFTQGTSQNLQTTTQIQQRTSQQPTSTRQVTQGTMQQPQTTSQVRQTTTQQLLSTSQTLISTSQLTISTNQKFISTSKVLSCNANGTCTPGTAMATCTAVVEVNTCSTVTTGPTAAASCTPTAASSGNAWTTTTCSTNTTGPTGASSCTATAASAGNSWITTTCTTTTTGPTGIATCSAVTASAGNSWIGTTCSTTTVAMTAASSCTPVSASSGNSWVTTTCTTSVVGPTGVSSCTAVSASAGNSWITTSCSTSVVGPAAVAATCTATSASAGNSWITTTCTTSTTTNVPVSACTAAAASAGNSWIATTCTTSTTGPTAISASCTAVSASAGNSWITTTCTTTTTGPTGVSSCTAVTASAGNSWIATTCSTSTSAATGVSSCSAIAASAGNSWIATSCSTTTTTNVAVSACTATTASAGNSWITTTCTTSTTGPSAVAATCTPVSASSGNSWITTTCITSVTGPTALATCTAVAASAGNSWIATTCATTTTAAAGVSSCTPVSASAGNSWITTTCTTTTTANVAVSACTATAASAGNSWITTTCTTSTTGPTAIATCTPVSASAGNSWITTTCLTTTLSATAVSTCTPVAASAGNSWVTTLCTTLTSSVGVLSCTPIAASAGNSWIATTCSTTTTTNVPIATCAATAASAGNSWITTTCATSTTANVAVSACTATSASAGNSWITTTCTTTTVGPTGVASCTAVSASAGNSWITTSCSTSVVSPGAIATCTPVSASAGNSWVTTTCSSSTTTNVPMAACTTTAASAGNGWITTSCVTSITTSVPLSACTATSASAGNSWVTTTCSTSTSGPTAIASCTPVSASAGNSWVTTSCATTTTGPTGIASCTAVGASAGNSWITTTCAPTSVLNTPIASCTNVSASAGNSWVTTTCATTTTSGVAMAACSPVSASAGNSWITTGCTTPSYSNVPVATCTATSASAGNSWITTTCASSVTTNVPVSSCSAVSASAGNSWVTTTCGTSVTTDVPAAACTNTAPSAGNSWVTTTCDSTSSTFNTTNVTVQTCTTVAAAAGNSYVSTSCAPQAGSKNQYQTQSRSRTDNYSGTVLVGSTVYPAWSTPFPAAGAWTDFSLCLATVPAIPADGQPGPTDPVTPPTGFDPTCSAWPCTQVSSVATGGSSNSLADVAQYYYKTDLRPSGTTGFNGLNVSLDIVPSSATDPTEGDKATWQHMTTFTMGLGVSGNVAYNKDYKNKPVGTFTAGVPDEPFQQIRCQDSSNAPLSDPNLCLNWPLPVAATPSAVDDLWHAAVNGRGQYFSAADPDAVFTGLQTALLAINAQSGAGTGATTSTQDPVPGNDLTFRAGFRTVDWTGDIRAQQLYTGTNLALEGTVLPGVVWSAQDKLDGQVGSLCDNRSIYLMRMGATNNMVPFTWSTKACDGSGTPTGTAATGLDATEQANFTSTASAYASPFNMSSWSQFLDMTDGTNGVDQRALAQGANLVNFLRGQRGMEDFSSGSSTKLFRKRLHVLGDIVGSQPRYVTAPNAHFTDTGYSLFKEKSGVVDRPAMLYAGGNDGMLHAFKVGTSVSDSEGGTEKWAVIPTAVVPNLYRLGDAGYSESHTYYVDSTPTSADVYDRHKVLPDVCAGATDPNIARDCWKTIIVGGLGAGGRGYYAMDVTNPTSPKALWEFKWSDTCYDSTDSTTFSADCHIGLTFGAPLVTKLVDGSWVVLASSGLNNVNSPAKAGDGKGYLYVLDAITGKIQKKISTGVGSAASDVAPLTGMLAVSATTAAIGSGTAFTTEIFPGQTITVNGESKVVQSIIDDTHLTVTTAFVSSGSYAGTVVRNGPSGFAYINAYVENYIQDNTSTRVYGGDMLGNVWRIELKGLADSTDDVVRLATLVDPSGNPQPITTTPQLMNVGADKTRTVFVGTGRYLGESDLSDTQVQTVYGLEENLNIHSDSAEYVANGDTVLPTAGLTLRQQLNPVVLSTLSTAAGDAVTDANTRKSTISPCSPAATAAGVSCQGWFADLPATGERVNLDMRLVLGSLIVPTNVTNLTACDIGGNSWLNVFDAATGGEVPGSVYKAGKYMPGAVTVGISLIRTQSGRIMSVLTKSDDTQQVSEVQTQQAAPLGRRSGWRDLLN